MKIDLHVHTSEYSRCAVSTEKEQIEAAIARGLDGIALTDHGHQRTQSYLESLNKKYAPFKIFAGVEVHTRDSYEDVLIIGVHGMAAYNGYGWTYPELYKFARQHGGFIAIPHPFRYSDGVKSDVVSFVPDALELKSKNIDPANERKILALAKKLGINTIVASDAHVTGNIGLYHLVLQNSALTEAGLVEELINGRYDTNTIQ